MYESHKYLSLSWFKFCFNSVLLVCFFLYARKPWISVITLTTRYICDIQVPIDWTQFEFLVLSTTVHLPMTNNISNLIPREIYPNQEFPISKVLLPNTHLRANRSFLVQIIREYKKLGLRHRFCKVGEGSCKADGRQGKRFSQRSFWKLQEAKEMKTWNWQHMLWQEAEYATRWGETSENFLISSATQVK